MAILPVFNSVTMLIRIPSASLHGIEAYLVEVEVDISAGLPAFIIVGLPDAAVRESKERVRAALRNCGFDFPAKKIIINLAPASRKKEGSSFDLPIALGLLAFLGVVSASMLGKFLFVGELTLEGSLKSVRGALPVALLASQKRFTGLVLPKRNEKEACLVQQLPIFGFTHLSEVISLLNGNQNLKPAFYTLDELLGQSRPEVDFSEVRGQQQAKRALEVAAAGSHNLLMIGPPGSGKTMLARRLPTILPDMIFEELVEVTQVYSAAGLLGDRAAISQRPFRSPHHTITDTGLVGGGNYPRPGEVSLAHHGVLFMDEFPEFSRQALESLRQPLEDGVVTISRVAGTISYPCSFMLVAAMNPCSEVMLGARGENDCTEAERRKYYARLSRPLLDRVDIQVEMPAVKYQDLVSKPAGEPSVDIKKRVCQARKKQWERFRGRKIFSNAAMGSKDIRQYCELDRDGQNLLEAALRRFRFSARAYDRILKVARTIADLSGEEKVSAAAVAEAIQYRLMDQF